MKGRDVTVFVRALMLACVLIFALGAKALAGDEDPFDLEVTHPIGGVWNEYANPGITYPPSLDVRAWGTLDGYDLSFEYHRDVYLTQSAGPGSLTRYATLTGGFATVPPFEARDTELDLRVMRPIRHHPLAIGLSALETMTNYPYPRLYGLGIGIAKLPDWTGPHVALFGSAFFYPAATGSLGPVHATFSIVRKRAAAMSPFPSIGSPSGLTTRPSNASPTGTEAMRPVRRTRAPSLISTSGPMITTPTLSSSRLSATPWRPLSNSTSSDERTPRRP